MTRIRLLLVATLPLSGASAGLSAQVTTVQPGAPGDASRLLGPNEISGLSGLAHTDADVRFMQGMILHHEQALEMTGLVPDRAQREEVRLMARRMDLSQSDEIGLMERWLAGKGEARTFPDSMATMHLPEGQHGPLMPGMLSPEQLSRLGSARGAEFDRLFLEYMIQHHEGALVMVGDLFATPGAGQEEEISIFAQHVEADQTIEIRRMSQLLGESP